MLTIDVSALACNLLVCWAVNRNHSLRTFTDVYMVSLAISDRLVEILCMPFSIVFLLAGKCTLGFEVCQFLGLSCFFFAITVKVLTVKSKTLLLV